MSHADEAQDLLRADREHRAATLSIVASENRPAPAVEAALAPDLDRRYGDYEGTDPLARKYPGQRYLARLEAEVQALAREAFPAGAG